VQQRGRHKAGLFLFLVNMNYSVYILYSSRLDRYYVGTTDDVQRRLNEHNNYKHDDAFTTRGVPWILYFSIDSLSSEKANQIERRIKRMKSKKYIQNLKAYPEMISRLRSE
jgi:putative endonuclease